MLWMTVVAQGPQQVVLTLYGTVAGRDVTRLREEGERHLMPAVQVIVELGGVQFIDEVGLGLLHEWVSRHAVLRGGSSFLRALLASEGLHSD